MSDAGARSAVSTFFFVNGFVLASWVPHIPAMKAQHAIGDGVLGFVLLCMAVGAVLALPLAGWLVGRFGSRAMTTCAGLALGLVLPLPVISPRVPLLALSLLVFGSCNALLDVSMNAQAVAVERRYGRAIMSSFHGLFSLGGLAGAAVASLVLGLGVHRVWHVMAVSASAVAALGAATAGLVTSRPRGEGRAPVFALPHGPLLVLGGLAFLGLLAEGAMGDWSAVYLHDHLGSTPSGAAAGFAAFSLAMAGGRFGGDRLVGRYGPAAVLRVSGALAALGLGTALAIGEPRVAVVGCGLVGLGISNVIPILFSAAGRVAGVPAGTALAAVATTGYLGLLAGPPIIGLVAEATSLPVALGLVSASGALIAALAGGVTRAAAAEPAALRGYDEGWT